MLATLLQLGVREWSRHRTRLVLTIAAVALGVGVFFAIQTANVALVSSLAQTVEQLAGRATLQVTTGESGLPESVLDQVRATPGVAVAEPIIEVIAHTAYADEGNLLILGIDSTGDQQLRAYQFDRALSQIADPITYLADPHSILLSRAFAQRHGLAIGDHVPLYTAHGRTEFTVQGIFQPTGIGAVFGGNVAVMDVYSAQVAFDRGRNFDRVDLLNVAGTALGAVQANLRQRLTAGIEVTPPATRGQALESAVTAMRLGMSMTSVIALLVGVYLIFNAFMISVDQRSKQIGILRALGVERRMISAMFLTEALLIGAVGSLLGIAGGYAAAHGASRLMGSIAAAVYGTVPTAVVPHLQLQQVFAAFGLGLLASLGAAWLPARAATRLDPILALHNVEVRTRERALGWQRLLIGAALLAASLALMEWLPGQVGATAQFWLAALMLLGLTLLMPLLVRTAARILRPAFDAWLGSEGALGIDAMIAAPRRSSATVGALMIGLTFTFSTAAYIQSYRHMIDRWTQQMLNADVFVATTASLRTSSFHFDEDLGRRIAQLPQIARTENVRFAMIPYRGDTTALIAYEMDGFLARAAQAIHEAGPEALSALRNGRAALVSSNFAARWGTHVGDRLQLASPQGTLEISVAGIVDDYRSDKGSVFLDRTLYRRWWHDAAVDFVDVELKPGQDATLAKRAIEHVLRGEQRALVYTNAEFRRWIYSIVDQFFLLNDVQLVIAIAVAFLGLVNTLVISILERQREFAILRAIGALRPQLRKLVLLEAVAIALVGVMIGAFGALFNILFLSRTVSTMLAGYAVPFYFPWRLIVISAPVAAVVALLAGWWPARGALRHSVVRSLGYE